MYTYIAGKYPSPSFLPIPEYLLITSYNLCGTGFWKKYEIHVYSIIQALVRAGATPTRSAYHTCTNVLPLYSSSQIVDDYYIITE